MKMKIERKDICKIQINDINLNSNHDWYSGLVDFETNIDDFTQNDDITIKVSGTCKYHGYGDEKENEFKGTLTMNEDDFIHEYKYAAADGKSYVTFYGEAAIKPAANSYVAVDYYNIGDTYNETIDCLSAEIRSEVEDCSDIIDMITKFVINESANKIIEEIKRIDNVDIDKDNIYDYVLENILNWRYSIKDDKYKSIDTILNAKVNEKSDELTKLINEEIEKNLDECEEKYDITAKVYFSDL